ncbi:AAC(3) family N-acetyltransferase [Maridesulfovibrio zosterae]|uniref:AAC(3) family N-acetyltransferase n=1 Tax=Maridesulfovibrio zosterae TaxID=82171 RepID=UPI00041EF5B8|nr:AAC(3) family N-acetyltransferase [Maridesulfovibrio zosterae]
MGRGSYNKADVLRVFHEAGLKKGDVVLSHTAILQLGMPEELFDGGDAFQVIFDAMMETIGPEGTFLVPTFSYSFCKGEDFDPQNTPSDVGPFGNRFLKLANVERSSDPIFSLAGTGPAVEYLFSDLSNECFGPGCIYEKLEKINAKVCQIGVGLEYLTAMHYLENMAGSPHRFNKIFSGNIISGTKSRKENWIYSVRTMGDYSRVCFKKAHDEAVKQGKARVLQLGRGTVTATTFTEIFGVARGMLKENPMALSTDPSVDPLQAEIERVPSFRSGVELLPDADLKTIVETVYPLPRDIVSDAYDEALDVLSQVVPIKQHAYRSGTNCFTWIVPERWVCRRASLESIDGKEIFSTDDCRLHVTSYSLPFNGLVSREKLMQHLKVHPYYPDAVPFTFKYYERDWGLACSQEQRDSLNEDEYRVKIDVDFCMGELKVGEIIVPGENDDCYVFCAHLCHPEMVNDDMAGVAVCVDVARKLLAGPRPKYTYRFLIVPETIGSAAYLSHNRELIPDMKGGVFLEMLATDHPHSLQKSLRGNTEIDLLCEQIVREHDPQSWSDGFARVIRNDERMFNSQGIGVDMLSLSRITTGPHRPYKEYHSSKDDAEHANFENLESSRDLVLKIIGAIENNRKPQLLFEGELFCSRFNGLDYGQMEHIIHSVTYYIDGKRSVAEIADIAGVPFNSVLEYCNILYGEGLLEWRD